MELRYPNVVVIRAVEMDCMLGEAAEAEHALRGAILVLGCISYTDEHLQEVAHAIALYGAGHYKAATILALAFIKGRSPKRAFEPSAPTPKSVVELEEMFRAFRKRPASIAPPQRSSRA